MSEIGCSPQVESFKVYGTITQLGKNSPILEEATLPEPILSPRAVPTTYLNGVVNRVKFLTINELFIDFLTEFEIGEYQSWKIKVHHKEKELNGYNLLYLPNPKQSKYIDYCNSQFYIGKTREWKYRGETVKVKNYLNYLSMFEVLQNDGYWLRGDKLIFNFNHATEDLFRLTDIPFGHGYYVSERLKNAIEKERFTGMAFKEIEQYNKKIKVIY